MKPITYTIGDATRPIGPGFKTIAHICNDAGAWGAGFVLALSARDERPELAYIQWASDTRRKLKVYESMKDRLGWEWDGPNMKREHPRTMLRLGETQTIFDYAGDKGLRVANMIAQKGLRWNGNEPPVSYMYLWRCLEVLAAFAKRDDNGSVHMPRIGCGLGGGEWPMIAALIEGTLCKADIPVFVYDLTQADRDKMAWRWGQSAIGE